MLKKGLPPIIIVFLAVVFLIGVAVVWDPYLRNYFNPVYPVDRTVEYDSVIIETIEIRGSKSPDYIQKICMDGTAYFIRPYAAYKWMAPVFDSHGKPQLCEGNKVKENF